MNILEMLKGGDLRSIGRADEVAEIVCATPKLTRLMADGINSANPVLRARCADALEKVAARFPTHLEFLKRDLLAKISKIDPKEVKWHVALILPRLSLSASERNRAAKLFQRWLETEKSNIVRVSSLQALFDLSQRSPSLKAWVKAKLMDLAKTGSPSLRARSRRLLK